LRELAHALADATRGTHVCIVEAVMPERDAAARDALGRRLHADISSEHAAFCDRLDELGIDPEFVQIVAVSLRLRRHLTTTKTIATVTGGVRTAGCFLLGLLLKRPERH